MKQNFPVIASLEMAMDTDVDLDPETTTCFKMFKEGLWNQ